MTFSESKKSSFATRIMTVLAITLMLVFSALLLLDNKEAEKLIPRSSLRSLTLILGYCVAILTSNYALAVRGRNLMDWRTEILLSLNFIALFVVCTLPWFFPVVTHCARWKVWCSESRSPDLALYWAIAVQAPLALYGIVRVRAFLGAGAIAKVPSATRQSSAPSDVTTPDRDYAN